MSRGPGRVQQAVSTELLRHDVPPSPRVVATCLYVHPTDAQVSAVRRAMRTLGTSSQTSDWLTDSAKELATRYFADERQFSFVISQLTVRWSTRLTRTWGKSESGLLVHNITLASRLQTCPLWVIDAVLVHELAHQMAPSDGHRPRHTELAHRYPETNRAMAFLEGYGYGSQQGRMYMD